MVGTMVSLQAAPEDAGQGEPEERSKAPRIVGGGFSQHGSLPTRCVFGGCKRVGLCTLQPESLKLTGLIQSLIQYRRDQKKTLLSLKGISPCNGSPLGTGGQSHVPRAGEG